MLMWLGLFFALMVLAGGAAVGLLGGAAAIGTGKMLFLFSGFMFATCALVVVWRGRTLPPDTARPEP